MRLNLRRGLFRLWLVVSALWVIGIGMLSFASVKDEFAKAATMRRLEADSFKPDIPVNCALARGQVKIDYREERERCWYGLDRFRALFPEYKNLNDNELSDRLYSKAGIPLTPVRPWGLLVEDAAMAFGPPLALLVIGVALTWALAGFVKGARHAG